METHDEIKNNLFEEFLALGGNYKKLDKSKALKKNINKHLQDMETADSQLLDLSRLLKISIKEIIYDTDFEELSEIASPIIDRLTYTNIADWDINDMRLSQVAICYVESFEKAHKLAKKTLAALSALKEHLKDISTHKFELILYLNVLSCFLKSAFFKVDLTRESSASKELKKLFKSYSSKTMKIYDDNKEELKAYEFVILIRIALFDRDSENAVKALEDLKKLNKKSLYDVMKKEVIKYSPHFGSDITQRQLSMLIGENVRINRKKKGISPLVFSEKLGMSDGYTSFVERGERNIPSQTLVKICDVLDISMDELFFGKHKSFKQKS